nr:hypothetical protein [Tanacetum cinerariifolium]
NLDSANGLSNGTTFKCKHFDHNVINAEVAVGQHAGVRVLLPRIPLAQSEEDMFPFKLNRTQFPVRLSFALTISKAQGQTILNVGVYLPDSVFSHGQLYVVLSRGISRTTAKIFWRRKDLLVLMKQKTARTTKILGILKLAQREQIAPSLLALENWMLGYYLKES